MTKITQLPVASTISDTGVFVIVDEGVTKQLSWQTLKTGGLKGDQGITGTTGVQGPIGPTGTVATISVGSVSVTTASTATVIASTSTISSHITILDFVIPQGPKGDTGVPSWSALEESLIPNADVAYDLGSATNRWRDLYLSEGTIVLGSTRLSGTVNVVSATIVDATTLEAVESFTVADSTGIEIGATFSRLPGMGETLGTVTNVVGDEIFFSPSITFTPNLTLPYDVSFNVSGGILVDGAPFGYDLPVSTSLVLGGVKIGAGIDVTSSGTISVNTGTPYVLTTASSLVLGGVKIGVGIGVTADGTISVTTGAFALQTATNISLGGVKVGTGIGVSTDGTISVSTASDSVVGGVKIGTGIDISNSGTISVSTGLSVASSLTGGTLASNVTASSLTSLGSLTGLVVNGITTIGQTKEKFRTISSSTGVVTNDCTNGTIFVYTSPTSNFTANFTNVGSGTNEVISFAVLISQGSTPRIPTAVQINSTDQILNWQGGVTPTGNANKVDLINFTVFLTTGTNIVLGSLSSYG